MHKKRKEIKREITIGEIPQVEIRADGKIILLSSELYKITSFSQNSPPDNVDGREDIDPDIVRQLYYCGDSETQVPWSTLDIAKYFNIHPSYLCKLMDKWKMPRRDKSTAQSNRYDCPIKYEAYMENREEMNERIVELDVLKERDNELIQLYRQKVSVKNLAEKFQLSKAGVYNILEKI